jgi:hypothetical protein
MYMTEKGLWTYYESSVVLRLEKNANECEILKVLFDKYY